MWVVLHLFKARGCQGCWHSRTAADAMAWNVSCPRLAASPQDHVSQCAILNECLEDLAKRYSNTKFLRIVSTDAIPKYPDAALPTLLVYQDGKKVKDFVGLEVLAGQGLEGRCIERRTCWRRAVTSDCLRCRVPLRSLQVFGGRRVTPEEVAIKLNQIGDICASDGNVEAASRREALKLLEKVAIEVGWVGGAGKGMHDGAIAPRRCLVRAAVGSWPCLGNEVLLYLQCEPVPRSQTLDEESSDFDDS